MQQALAEQMELLTARLTAIQGTNSLLLASAHSTQARLAALDQSVTDINKHQAAAQRAIDSARSELASLVAARASGMPAHTNVQSSAPNLGQFKPNISGVTVISNQTGCIIRFDPGLFDRDQHFKIGAKARLQSVAKALVQTQAKIKIAVVGVADDEPTTWPWSRTCTSGELGLQRAQCVMAYLRSLGILPSDKLFAISGLPSQRPYPAPDRNNRTVLLAISVE
jgi:outer membrane protein OmpA-like peptidoglycan-associated protein